MFKRNITDWPDSLLGISINNIIIYIKPGIYYYTKGIQWGSQYIFYNYTPVCLN